MRPQPVGLSGHALPAYRGVTFWCMLLGLLLSIGTAVRRYAKDPMDEVPLPIMRLG